MKAYVQFYDYKLDNTVDEALGSDSVFILDARNNLDTMINDAYERIEKLKNVQKYRHFQIREGDLKCYRVVYSTFRI